MTGLPGSPSALVPPGEDETQRRLRDLERAVQEIGPAIARSLKPESRLDTQGAFAITTTQTTFSTITLTVPGGYAKAVFVYSATCWGTNHAAVAASITLWPTWTSGSSSQLYGGPSGPSGAVNANVVTSYTVADTASGLVPGNTLVFTSDAFASASGFGSTNTGIAVSLLVLWLR